MKWIELKELNYDELKSNTNHEKRIMKKKTDFTRAVDFNPDNYFLFIEGFAVIRKFEWLRKCFAPEMDV